MLHFIGRQGFAALIFGVLCAGCGGGHGGALKGAEEALAAGDYREAEILLRNLLEKDEADASAQLLLSRALLQQGEYDAADRALRKAAESGIDAPVVRRERARQQLERGDPVTLLADLEADGDGLTPEEHKYFRARALQAMNRVAEALPLYEELLAGRPGSQDLHLRIAQGHFFHGRLAAAEDSLNIAAEGRPAAGEPDVKAEIYMLRAAILQRKGDLQAARAAIAEAISAAPGQLSVPRHVQLLLTAIEDALRGGDVERAHAPYAELVKLQPQALLTAVTGARLDLASDKPQEAVSSMQLLRQKAPDFPMARVILVAALARTGALEQAGREAGDLATSSEDADVLRQAQRLIREAADAPAGSPARAMAIASALVSLQQPAAAREVLREALTSHPDEPSLALAMAHLHLSMGQSTAALELARSVQERFPDVPAALLALAEAQVANGQHAEADETCRRLWDIEPGGALAITWFQVRNRGKLPEERRPLEQWLSRHPEDVPVRLTLAMALQETGWREAAIDEYQRVTKSAPANAPERAVALNNLAWLYHEKSDRRALETARAAHAMATGQPAMADTYGWMLVQAGRAAEGLPLIQEAAAQAPESAEIRYHLAAALAAAGDKESARLHLRDVLLDPTAFPWRADAEALMTRL